MRSVPAAITTGFSSNYLAFWVAMVEASGGNTYYWTTASKNRTGHSFTLKKTAAGGALSPDSTMIAARDLASGEEYDGLGPMESGGDIYEGGGIATVSDLEIQILNQVRFDETIIQGNINIENRPITIYFGFIPDGASQIVVIDDDMFMRWKGVVEDVLDFNYQDFVLRCVDGSFQRHKDIPTTVIDKTNYPRAPKESVGKVLPVIYGDFAPTDEETPRKIQTFSPCPTILVDGETRKFIIADHILDVLNTAFVYSSENNLFGATSTPSSLNGASAPSYVDWNVGGLITAVFYQQLKTLGIATSSGLVATFPNTVDEDLTNLATLNQTDSTKRKLYGVIENPQNIGTLISFKFTVLFGIITGTVITHAAESGVQFQQYTSAHSNTEQSTVDLIIGVGGITSLVDQYGADITDYSGATAEIKNMFLKTKYYVANFARKPVISTWTEMERPRRRR